MSARESLFADARRKLVGGTEVLRTGGGVTLTAGECAALIEEDERLRSELREVAGWASKNRHAGLAEYADRAARENDGV